MLDETLSVLLFFVAIPVVVQAIKIYKDRTGNTLSKLANQAISLFLAGGALLLGGGFAGVAIPELPVLVDGDLIASVSAVLEFLVAFVATLLVVWTIMSGLYELVYDRLLTALASRTGIGLVTADKLAVG